MARCHREPALTLIEVKVLSEIGRATEQYIKPVL